MEYFNSLYNRLDGNKEKQMQLFLIRENAINEIHNANVLAQLHTNPEFTEKWTNLTPEQRVVEKVSIAKSVGKSHVPHTMPAPKTDGELEVLNRLSDFHSSTPDIPYLVAMMNLPSQVGQDQDKAFLQTVKILKTLLLSASINAICTESGIAKVLEIYTGGQILIMHEKYPWTQAVLNYPDVFKDCLIAVYPDRNNRWRVQSLPLSKAQRFTNRLPAPAAWRGLNDKDLDEATGISTVSYTHLTLQTKCSV